ncbi:HEPN domain-containing protein [Acinetobacter junii]|uniref:HEPN domain-containing protein n=1 Tax=Acinetobacter junii TaxID=40215 RepID=UPI00244AA36C|nr:HEPN domain-containing protein [Acinetobacter junii]MDH1857865.1 HEPN domain-containing protein [Acinetobacter junii]
MLTEIQNTFKQNRENFNEDFRLRIHRSLSWLQRAEQAQQEQDLDSQFIYLWISFNAAYAKDLGAGLRSADKGAFVQFIYRICHLDKEQKIYYTVWNTFSGSIRILLNNQFTFQPFWDYHNGLITEQDWIASFEKNRKKALEALTQKNTPEILIAVFNHLYTLRNQIMHGGATFNSTVNRSQLKDACNILSTLIPEMLKVMLQNPDDKTWGKPFYPVVKG